MADLWNLVQYPSTAAFVISKFLPLLQTDTLSLKLCTRGKTCLDSQQGSRITFPENVSTRQQDHTTPRKASLLLQKYFNKVPYAPCTVANPQKPHMVFFFFLVCGGLHGEGRHGAGGCRFLELQS